MRIAQDLSISRIRKAGKSLTVRCAARFTRGRSGRTQLGPEHRHESECGHSLSLGAGERLAPGALKADWSKNGGKMAQKGAKSRLLREKATLVVMAQLLYCHVVALIIVK